MRPGGGIPQASGRSVRWRSWNACGAGRAASRCRSRRCGTSWGSGSTICTACWKEWLAYQQALINHYGLDVRDREARDFLTQNMEAYLFETEEPEDIDTSEEGNISW
jgi:hypothetical protein